MKLLKEHIDKSYNGNITHFAEKYGVYRQQVQKWIAKGAMWQNGRVYLEPAKHAKSKIRGNKNED